MDVDGDPPDKDPTAAAPSDTSTTALEAETSATPPMEKDGHLLRGGDGRFRKRPRERDLDTGCVPCPGFACVEQDEVTHAKTGKVMVCGRVPNGADRHARRRGA